MIEIKTKPIRHGVITVPGSKSYSHRILIAAALSDGVCTVRNCLDSEDTCLTRAALKDLGVPMICRNDRIEVHGTRGIFQPCYRPIYLGNSGTSMRLVTALAALGKGVYRLTGTRRMQQRPIQHLLNGLIQVNVSARSVHGNGCPPVEIVGGRITGGHITLNCSLSSQYLSALLLIAPYTETGMDIVVDQGPVSRPYVDMTIDVMEKFGIEVHRKGYERFFVAGNHCYRCGTYTVEPDCSQAGYFWAAAAITGSRITVKGITKQSRQGDVGFTDVLEQMGCNVTHTSDGITVSGDTLHGVDIDMKDMPDLVPTLAVVSAFARGTTTIKQVAHLKQKESDRLSSVVHELQKMGVDASCEEDSLVIHGGHAHGAEIETYEDHRMAMSFALAGLKIPGIRIRNERCVDKSFPKFWEVFEGMYRE